MPQCKRCWKTNTAEIHTCTPWHHWIQNYNNALYTIINAFVEKYYTYDDDSVADFDIIGINSNMHPWPVEIADYFRSISDIYTALLNDIPSDTLFERYDYSLNQYELKQPITNLYNYYLKSQK